MILGIETSGDTASVALVRGGEVERERSFPSRMTLNQRLAPQLRELLGEDVSGAGLQMIAAGVGPGSFTGVRMGVAIAKALAHALRLPLAGVSAPEAIVSGLRAAQGSGVCVLQRARGEEVYATVLAVEEAKPPAECAPTRVLTVERALEMAEELLQRQPEIIAGDAVAQFAERIEAVCSGSELAEGDQGVPTAAEVVRVAAARPEAARDENAFSLTPRYVRLSQAERQFGVDLGLTGGPHA